MTVMAEYQSYQLPHRRPVGTSAALATQPAKSAVYPAPQPSPTHYHSRTASSALFSPSAPHPAPQANAPFPPAAASAQATQQAPANYVPQPNRRLTNSTMSSKDSSDRQYPPMSYQQPYAPAPNATQPPPPGGLPQRTPSTYSGGAAQNLRRSTSSRSQASSLGPTSYVALLRKQKATVWSDRTQQTDPRVAMQAKVARARAAHDIMSQGGRASTTTAPSVHTSGGMLSRNKNKHANRAQTGPSGAGANLSAGVGVPMRLSASEVGDEEEDEEDGVYSGGGGGVHRRTGSGRSSLGATSSGAAGGGNRLAAPRTSTRLSYGSGAPTMTSETGSAGAASAKLEKADSIDSAGSEERREKEAGDIVPDMKAPSAAEAHKDKLSASELARRGSVDERSHMRGAAGAMRLFVANPDADSD